MHVLLSPLSESLPLLTPFLLVYCCQRLWGSTKYPTGQQIDQTKDKVSEKSVEVESVEAINVAWNAMWNIISCFSFCSSQCQQALDGIK